MWNELDMVDTVNNNVESVEFVDSVVERECIPTS